jgi:hypothetical protein
MSSDSSSQHHRKSGSGTNPASRAGVANLIPYKAGQSGNPGGRPRGIPRLSNCYERLLQMSVEELQQFRPANAAEAMALRQVVAAIYGVDGLPAVKEITDRTEGKAIQRRIDLTEAEAVISAKRDYEIGRRYVEALNAALEGEICADACEVCAVKVAARIRQVFAESDLIGAILATTDERYHEAVRRELEAMADERNN